LAKARSSQTGRQARFEQVISATLKLFLSRGFSALSLDDIAIKAAIETDQLIEEFKDKQSLALLMMDQIEYNAIEPLVARVADAHATPQGKLVGLLNGFSTIAAKQGDYFVLLIRFGIEFKGRGDELEDRTKVLNSHLVKVAQGIVNLGAERGAFRTDIGSADLAALIVGSLNGMLLEWWRRRDEVDGAKSTRTLRRMILRGLEEAVSREDFGISRPFPGHHP